MALKRKPPVGNVCRVASIGKNIRGVTTNKRGRLVQFESEQERKLIAPLRQRADTIIQTVTAVQTYIAQLQRDASPPLSQIEATRHACQLLFQPIASSTYYPPLRAQTVYYIAQQLWHHNQRWWLNFTQTGSEGMDDLIERLLDARQDIHSLLADPEQKERLVQIPRPAWACGWCGKMLKAATSG